MKKLGIGLMCAIMMGALYSNIGIVNAAEKVSNVNKTELSDIDNENNGSDEIADVIIDDTNFPDDTFRDYVKIFDLDNNGVLSVDEIKKVEKINCGGSKDNKIKSLKGIEFFPFITFLNCRRNQLEELDLSNNVKLKCLLCGTSRPDLDDHGNFLRELDLRNNKELIELECNGNQLTSIDLSSCKNLKTFSCSNNQLEKLDLVANINLNYIGCGGNQLTSIDLGEKQNPLTITCSNNKLEELDISRCTRLTGIECNHNNLESLDVSKNIELSYLKCDSNHLTTLDFTNNTNMRQVYCDSNQLQSIEGISNIKDELRCNNNQLTSLDLTNVPNLFVVSCNNNKLTEVVFPNTGYLLGFDFTDNQLTTLYLNEETYNKYVKNPERYLLDDGVVVRNGKPNTSDEDELSGDEPQEKDDSSTNQEDPKKEESKQEDPKEEESKPEESKSDDTKQDDAKQENAGQVDNNTDKKIEDNSQVDNPQNDAKADESVSEQEETTSEETKAEEEKQEEEKEEKKEEKQEEKKENIEIPPAPVGEEKVETSAPTYSNEWIDGKWYGEDGSQSYEGTIHWESNSTGWWIEDSIGWYPTDTWQKIDGVWYYFKPDGYMASNEYYGGYWFNGDGSWDETYYIEWKSNSTGWWIEDISGWWPSSCWLKIDDYWYYFDGSGYMVTNQYIDGYWLGADGVCY